MKDGWKLLPDGWRLRIGVTVAAALAGNLLVRVVPWPAGSLAAFEAAMKPAAERPSAFLMVTLFTAPLAEELLFRGVPVQLAQTVYGILVIRCPVIPGIWIISRKLGAGNLCIYFRHGIGMGI